MKDLIEYVCTIFGLELNSKIALLDMESDIGIIQDHASYVRYLKNWFNLDDIKYLTSYQKFITLTKRYKNIEAETINRSRIEAMGSLAERLAQKVRQFDISILNHPHKDKLKWEHIKSTDDVSVNYFGEKEIKALNTIGSPLHCVELQRAISGKDMLCERLEAIFVKKVVNHTALEYKQPERDTISAQTHNLIADITAQKGMR